MRLGWSPACPQGSLCVTTAVLLPSVPWWSGPALAMCVGGTWGAHTGCVRSCEHPWAMGQERGGGPIHTSALWRVFFIKQLKSGNLSVS